MSALLCAERFLQARLTAFSNGVPVVPWPIPEEMAGAPAITYRMISSVDRHFNGDGVNPVPHSADLVYQVVAVTPGPNLSVIADAVERISEALKGPDGGDADGRVQLILRRGEINTPYKPDDKPLRQMAGAYFRLSVTA